MSLEVSAEQHQQTHTHSPRVSEQDGLTRSCQRDLTGFSLMSFFLRHKLCTSGMTATCLADNKETGLNTELVLNHAAL